ncbi:uncharacterized protein LOC143283847 [Babylonia areolata]|uniref:uncharacterized protein LOC143283847 n=1 Tax=Babylonia areolata TaxID=304850 RepID=UPI003FD30076
MPYAVTNDIAQSIAGRKGKMNSSDGDVGVQNNTVPSFFSQLTSHPEYQAAVVVGKVWPPSVLLLGAFGNIATIFVMRRIKDHNSSQYAILIALAVCDLTLLYTGALRLGLVAFFQIDMRKLHAAICKLHVWLVYSTGSTSAWLVTSVTVQRTMAVLWPHRMQVVWTVRRTRIVIVALALIAFVIHSHLLAGMQIVNNTCDAAPGLYLYFLKRVYFLVDLCMSSLLPSFCMLVCDVILSVTLFKAISFSSLATRAMSTSTSPDGGRKKTASRTTVMVLALSCTFLMLTMPVCVSLMWYTYYPIAVTPQSVARAELVYAVAFSLWYCNSAVNFLLYCLTGAKFRREFWNWVRCRHISAASGGETGVGSSSGGRKPAA